MSVDKKVVAWREQGEHLPEFMQDFHDQKELFKTVHEQAVTDPRSPDWIAAHTYTVDAFLWFMARHGYVLQKSRAKLPFANIEQTLISAREKRQQASAAVLREALNKL